MADMISANTAVLLGLTTEEYSALSEQDRAKRARDLYAVGSAGGPSSLQMIQERLVQQMRGMGIALADVPDLFDARRQLIERLPADKRVSVLKSPLYQVIATVAAQGANPPQQAVRKVMFTNADTATAQGQDFTNAVFRDLAMLPPSQRQAFIDGLIPKLSAGQIAALPRHPEFARYLASAAARGIVPKAKGPS